MHIHNIFLDCVSFFEVVPLAGVLVEVLAEAHQEGDLPQVAGQEDVHQTTTTDSPDPLVEISGLLPLLVREALLREKIFLSGIARKGGGETPARIF